MLEREAAILSRLDGVVNQMLLETGVWEDRDYLVLEWCSGKDSFTAASELRRGQSPENRQELIRLCCAILRAYSHLHDQGVIHSDVHPRNILVDDQGGVKVVDYGLSRLDCIEEEFGEPLRGGIAFFFEPEYAAAVREGCRPPKSSAWGEQYSLAALLYFLLAGDQYRDFSLTSEEMMREIMEEQPFPFSRRGVRPWPAVERILSKALSKVPSERFDFVSQFASALSSLKIPDEAVSVAIENTAVDMKSVQLLLNSFLRRVAFSGTLIATGLKSVPKASVT
jgi:eukaryotic-like serine/threonine-protein kinase